ncbi:glutamate ABC transporter substrate-binding protein [uncultured Friedmanniella sp.]|uniref:glutamate ABC transporter substrate-binding protein n=1 Tax=uncultured Friedmanniella sp. TaxID=335381 RepID=UPI0035CB845A
MRTIQRRIAAAALAAVTAITLAGCGSGGEVGTPAPLPGASGGSLKIGISFDQPGLGLKTGDTYTGFDVDTATYVAAALGVSKDKITWVEANPADREKLLEDGSADLVFSTYSITEDRKQEVDFAGPYFVAHQTLLVRRNEEDISSPETLNGRTLCSVTGTTSSAYIKDNFKGKITLKEYPKFSDCVSALAASTVDAVTTDDVILAGFAATPQYKGKLRLVGKGFTDERYGVGVKKGNTDLVTKVNEALKQYITDGSWKKSLQNNVGPSGYSIPSPPTPGTA